MTAPKIGLALGGGGARGLAHIHVLEAFDDLGLKPAAVAGSSIGAIMGAGYAFGMSGREVREFTLATFSAPQNIARLLWASRPTSFAEFRADGGFRFGQLNAERMLSTFIPHMARADFADLPIPLTVMATDFYARACVPIRTGSVMTALAASAALPTVFRPVRREGAILIDGGIYEPLPFELLRPGADHVVAVDVNGGPEGEPSRMPTPVEAMFGASQLMQQSIIEAKLRLAPPDLLFRPPVARWRVLDFLKAREILDETVSLREEAKRRLGGLIENPVTPLRAKIAAGL
ncbi:patatin-like phospholipase family protein [Aureimonas psammosilenae]|uniref:patatin-like phospholipase family protein n=1 Tax=Aureimonas psammosilenae TaxID=2495496 RepID=UPI00126095DF|nr:patatin-like phospholipase family protein [Aureimonas psammosilenae]